MSIIAYMSGQGGPEWLVVTATDILLKHGGGGAEDATAVGTAAWTTAALLVLATNVPLIILILSKTFNTFLDWMIIADCCIGVVSSVFVFTEKLNIISISNSPRCFTMFFILFLNILNRLLNISIAAFRYVFIIHNSVVQTNKQRRIFHVLILSLVFIPSLLLTGLTIYYRDNYYSYLSMKVFQDLLCFIGKWRGFYLQIKKNIFYLLLKIH